MERREERSVERSGARCEERSAARSEASDDSVIKILRRMGERGENGGEGRRVTRIRPGEFNDLPNDCHPGFIRRVYK